MKRNGDSQTLKEAGSVGKVSHLPTLDDATVGNKTCPPYGTGR